MSTLKVNKIQSFSGDDIIFDGNFVPSSSKGGDLTLGTEANPWSELYVSTGSVNFVAPGTPAVSVAKIKAGGETNAGVGPIQGMIFTETNNLRGSFSVGRNNQAQGTASLANGFANTASGNFSHAEGYDTISSGDYAHAEGFETIASGAYAHTEGRGTIALGQNSHAEGYLTRATENATHAEGYLTTASAAYSHAEGQLTKATGGGSHAEGYGTIASGSFSHAEGDQTLASGDYSHAGGYFTTASGFSSFAQGREVKAGGEYQTVIGQYNDLNNSASIFVVGAGGDSGNRRNGFSVEVDGTRPHVVIPCNQSLPNNPRQGSMFFNQDTNLLYIHNGTAWRSASFA